MKTRKDKKELKKETKERLEKRLILKKDKYLETSQDDSISEEDEAPDLSDPPLGLVPEFIVNLEKAYVEICLN